MGPIRRDLQRDGAIVELVILVVEEIDQGAFSSKL
jgi:hypothetical protein